MFVFCSSVNYFSTLLSKVVNSLSHTSDESHRWLDSLFATVARRLWKSYICDHVLKAATNSPAKLAVVLVFSVCIN